MGQIMDRHRFERLEDGQKEMEATAQNQALSIEMKKEKRSDETEASAANSAPTLHQAARNGNIGQVTEILAERADAVVNAIDDKGYTALHYAVQNNHEDIAKLLILNGADLEIESERGHRTALHIAASKGYHGIVKLLLEPNETSPANVHPQDIHRMTPLHLACRSGDEGTIQSLLDHRADVKQKDKLGQTPLHLVGSHAHVVDILMRHGADVNDQDNNGETPLCIASRSGHNETVATLLKNRADVKIQDHHGRTSLHTASHNGYSNTVTMLLEHEETEINKMDNNGEVPLHHASRFGHTKTVILLLGKKAEVNRTDNKGKTPLHGACRYGHLETVTVLLRHAAEINRKDDEGRSPVHHACYYGRTQVVEFLLRSKRADFAECDDKDYNPLVLAIQQGHEDTVKAVVNNNHWWKKLFKTCKNQTTPMREAIIQMPDVTALVLDRCISHNKAKHSVKFDYQLIEDFRDVKAKPSIFSPVISLMEKGGQIFYPLNGGKSTDWGPTEGYDQSKHPLKLMAESGNLKLMEHPLVTRLLDSKWKVTKVLFITNLLFHCLFLSFLTALALTAPNPLSESCQAAFNRAIGNTTDGGNCEQSYSRRQFIYAAAVLVIMFAIFRLLMEISQVFNYRDTKSLMDLKQKKQKGYYWHNLWCYWRYWQYFHDWENWMEIVMILFAIMFASVFNAECLCAHQWQWQIGTIAVFLAWSDFILFLQKIPALGIYVVMLVDIVKRFIKAVPIILMLVLAFGFGFFMLFFEPGILRSPFSTAARSLLSIVTFSAGGFDYNGVFHLGETEEDNELKEIAFPEVSYILWIVFIIIMPILLNNLLIGLAVGDTAEVLQRAESKILSLKIELILSVEAKLPDRIRRKLIVLESEEDESKDLLQEVKEQTEYQTISLELKTVQDNKQEISQLMKEVQEMKQTLEKVLNLLERQQ